MSAISKMSRLLEDADHDRLVRRADSLADELGGLRKKLLAFQAEFKREVQSPFALHLADLTGQLARLAKDGIVDIEKSASLLEPDF